MFDYTSIKTMAKSIGRPVKDLIALSAANDPFYAGVGHRGEAAEWFAGIWRDYAGDNPHLRRIHYKLVSPPEGVQILLPSGREYQNTERDWTYLCGASLAARYLDLIPFEQLVDRRNDEPMLYAPNVHADPNGEREVSCIVLNDDVGLDVPDMPSLPGYAIDGLYTENVVQNYVVEVWIEKSTQNDWLVPLCKRRGVNLVVGIGEQSEIRSRQLALRAAAYGAPARILYLSDFDPGGRSMPKAVARKVEFTIAKFGLDVDLQLIPLALTPDQCLEYRLPRTPIKDTERRKDKFETIFGVGATELDALEALYPGEMAKLVEGEIDNFLDGDLRKRVDRLHYEQRVAVSKVEHEIVEQYDEQVEALTGRFESIVEQLHAWQDDAEKLWTVISTELENELPDLSDVEVPCSEAPGETDRFVLFDSTRNYLSQMDAYNAWREGDE